MLLQVLTPLFSPLEGLHDKTRLATSLGLVCKAWKGVAEAIAWQDVTLDVEDSAAVAYLDPTAGGPACRILPCISSLDLYSSEQNDAKTRSGSQLTPERMVEALKELAAKRQQREARSAEADGRRAGDDDKPFFTHGITVNRMHFESESLRISGKTADILAAILAGLPNLTVLALQHGLEETLVILSFKELGTLWPVLRQLRVDWRGSLVKLMPVLSAISRIEHLKILYLIMVTYDDEGDDPLGVVDSSMLSRFPIRPLDQLEKLVTRCLADAPNAISAVARLLSPSAPLTVIYWGGFVPPTLCKKLARPPVPMQTLAILSMRATQDFNNTLIPQLHELGRRKIRHMQLTVWPIGNIGPQEQSMPTVGNLLNNLPTSIGFVDARCTVELLGPTPFESDTCLIEILRRPPVPLKTRLDNGKIVNSSFQGRPLAQTVWLCALKDSPARVWSIFARYGDPRIEGDLSEWMLVRPVLTDQRGRVLRRLDPEANSSDSHEDDNATSTE
ncbi:hypothetical protein JCM10908_003662 [Rhodotorula pacifica]|uniref:uncharacterized protein n=1 Tax=Rhodotorula pacifica TaxID=1495444 RepID=UPI00316DD68D